MADTAFDDSPFHRQPKTIIKAAQWYVTKKVTYRRHTPSGVALVFTVVIEIKHSRCWSYFPFLEFWRRTSHRPRMRCQWVKNLSKNDQILTYSLYLHGNV